MKTLKYLKDLFTQFFKQSCPLCGGKMSCEMLDMEFDSLVYKCDKCNKEFI